MIARLIRESPRRNWSSTTLSEMLEYREFGQACDTEQLSDLLGHHHAHPVTGAPLEE